MKGFESNSIFSQKQRGMMMLAPNGNMVEVYVQTERNRIRQIKRNAVKSITESVRCAPVLEAEITEGATANWYLVNVSPGDDVRAMRWLARRHFGVFRPMQQRIYKPRGIAVQGWEAVFPGWLFVMVWDIQKMGQRIQAIPGVRDILSDPASGRPVAIDDDFIDRLRALGWVYKENAPNRTNITVTCNRHRKRRPRPGKRLRKALNATTGLCTADWANANKLASQERIDLLKAAILPRLAGSSSAVADERVD